MGLASEMKNLSEEILNSFKNRIKENEELVNEVQETLDGFHKDQQDMASVLKANAAALRKGLTLGEKERMSTYNELLSGIHSTIDSIQKDVVAIQTSTFNLINEFGTDREQMAAELNRLFTENRAGRMQNEKNRMKEFDALMKNINDDIKSINDEVLSIFKTTNDILARFEKEHLEMSDELRAELSKNLAERVEYTRTVLNGFQKRLSEISTENQQMAQKLRKDLALGESERLNEYKEIMKGIHLSIKGIRNEVNDIQKATARMIGDYSTDRKQGAAEWDKMQDAIAQLKKTGVSPPKEVKIKEAKKAIPVIQFKDTPVEAKVKATVEVKVKAPVEVKVKAPVEAKAKAPVEAKVKTPITLEERVLNYINNHPKGVKIAQMEEPLGETRMKLGYTAKTLLDGKKVKKIDNVYFPLK